MTPGPRAIALALLLSGAAARAQDFPPGVTRAPDTGRALVVAPASAISSPYYGIAHGGGAISLANLGFSAGNASFTLSVSIAPWAARNSEGVFYAEIWVEECANGGWTGDIEGYSGVCCVNATSGTPPAGGWSWSKSYEGVAPGTQFRAFGYCYMYNQGGGRQGEYALYSWMDPVSVPAPVQMTPPVSNAGAITYGQGWAPVVSGGEGTGPLLYCVAGLTNFSPVSTSVTPPAAGSYAFYVAQLSDGTNAGNDIDPILGEMEVNPSPYALTVNPAAAVPPASADASIRIGQAWTPDYFGGTPAAGPCVFAVAGQTNFGSSPASLAGSWTPAAAGSYTFYVGRQVANPNFTGGNADPNIGLMQVNPTPYTVAVSKADQQVASSDAAVTYGQPFTPAYSEIGGGGSGLFQFCVAGFTRFDGGTTPDTGTSDPALGNAWEPSWTPPAAGTYAFSVAEDGSAAYNPASPAAAYTLTVNPAAPPDPSLSPASSSVTAGSSVSLTAGGGRNGYCWAVAPAGPTGISGGGAGQTITFPSPGNYVVSVYSPAGGNYTRSNSATATVAVGTAEYTLSTSATGNGSVTAGGVYPAGTVLSVAAVPGSGAAFAGWTGGIVSDSNPLSVTMAGDLALCGNFTSLQPQTITFSPPPTATFPGPAIALAASASSGLPVALTVAGGPGILSGNRLTVTGTGPVAVRASQAGDSQWLPAPPVTAVITASAPASIARIRFHSAGHDALASGPGPRAGISAIWTDPDGLQGSPWPSFADPQPVVPAAGDAPLPAVPAAGR